MELKVNTGKEPLIIRDVDGEILAQLAWNPADPGMAKRAQDAIKELEGKETADLLTMEADVCRLMDDVFGCNLSGTVFRKMSPLAIMEDGRFFWAVLMDSLMPAIENAAKKRAEKAREHIQRYADGYQPGVE